MGFRVVLGLLVLALTWPLASQADPKIVVRLGVEESRVGDGEICITMLINRVDQAPKTARRYTRCFPASAIADPATASATLKQHLVTRLGQPPFNFPVTAAEILLIGGLQ